MRWFRVSSIIFFSGIIRFYPFIFGILNVEKPTSVGIKSCSFYGGFDRYLTGFELKKDNFLRIFKYIKGSTWLTHRPPTITYPPGSNIIKKHIDSDTLYAKLGVQMYHYSYVFPDQVKKKVDYYKDSVSKEYCIHDYFNRIYLPWVIGDEARVEKKFKGVHEFKPEIRGNCFTEKFTMSHPTAIDEAMDSLKNKFRAQFQKYVWGDDTCL